MGGSGDVEGRSRTGEGTGDPRTRRSGLLDPVVQAARDELQNVGLPADRILVLRAIWRDLLIGFAQPRVRR